LPAGSYRIERPDGVVREVDLAEGQDLYLGIVDP
jgi:hypothetical protein